MIYYGQTIKDGNLGMYNKTIDNLYLMQNLKSAIRSINILQNIKDFDGYVNMFGGKGNAIYIHFS